MSLPLLFTISGLFFQVRTEYGKLRKEADILEGHALRYESLNLWHVIKNILSTKIEEYVKPICGMIPDVTLSFVVGVAISLSKGCTMAMKIFSKKMLKALRKATEDFVFETGILTGKEDEAKILNRVIFEPLGSMFQDIEGRNKKAKQPDVESIQATPTDPIQDMPTDSDQDTPTDPPIQDTPTDPIQDTPKKVRRTVAYGSMLEVKAEKSKGNSEIADGVFKIVGDVLTTKLDQSFKQHWHDLDKIAELHCKSSGDSLEKLEIDMYINHRNKLDGLKEELNELEKNYNDDTTKSLEKLDSK